MQNHPHPAVTFPQDVVEAGEKSRKRKLAYFLKKRDEELRAEQQADKLRGSCPVCHYLRLTTGACPNGH